VWLATLSAASAQEVRYVIEVNTTGAVKICVGPMVVTTSSVVNADSGNYRLYLTKSEYDQATAGTLSQAVINTKLAALKDALADPENMKPLLKAIIKGIVKAYNDKLPAQYRPTPAEIKAAIKSYL